ncbi:hypothetical protein FPOA_06850 [Fusarium poae]|uniref:Uncharacterized protein n=1 Tax=Fusarium poae TaxID=36050 RepID=A0A1B8AIU1_FUSPO|nr:hypothetical protein FPOA_06850 [Fusarium poae]
MPNDLDKSLLDRLNALRGKSAGSEKPVSTEIKVDLIERKKTPTREDTLAARLKSLRERSDEPSPPVSKSLEPSKPKPQPEKADEEDEAMFQTDDQTLEELLGDVKPEEGFSAEPDDAQVKALLEQLADAIPKDTEEKQDDSDDSDGEAMNKDVDQVIARFRDEVEVEAALAKTKSPEPESDSEPDDTETDIALPEVPSDLNEIPSTARAGSADIDDITARLAALRAPSPDAESSLALPSVPTSKPSGKPVNRLNTRTNYTDDDVESWCTVCLEDATLRCPGCDDDVYCTRCWYEMHRGPQAGFDERSHKAVQFTKEKKTEKKEKKRVALGA